MSDGTLVSSFPFKYGPTSLLFSPDGQKISMTEQGSILQVHAVTDGRLLWSAPVIGHSHVVNCYSGAWVAFA
jgi:hypothetical protein